MQVGLTYDLIDDYAGRKDIPPDISMEFDTEATIQAIQDAIEQAGHHVLRIGNVYQLVPFLAAGKRADIVFNVAEGLWGRAREAQIGALLEAYQIPYTLSDPLTMALCLDKALTKRLWQHEGLPTPPFAVIADPCELDAAQSALPDFPLFVKPVHEGSSMGIGPESIVTNGEALCERVQFILEQYRQPALVEAYLPGREYTVGILGNGRNARVLGVTSRIEAVAVSDGSQKERWTDQAVEPIQKGPLRDQLEDLALRAYRAVECKDAGRLDTRLDKDGKPHLLEINALMGLRPKSSALPIIARQAGLSYPQLIGEILQHALKRWGLD
jgi:D-alanine-D-alanine ligase